MRALLAITWFVASGVFAQQPGDLAPEHAGPVELLTPGTYPLRISVRNVDMDYAIDSLQAHWQLDGGPVHSCAVHTFTVYTDLLYPTFSDMFIHADPLVVSATGLHELKVWTSMPGGFPDLDPSNDTLITTVRVVDALPAQHTMMFYGTHVLCIPCGTYGEQSVAAVLDSFPDGVHMTSVFDHTPADPYEVPEGQLFNELYIWPYTGHPAFVFDVFRLPFLFDVTTHIWSELYRNPKWRLEYRSPVELTVEALAFDTASRILSGEVHADFWADHNGALTMNAIITEDSVYGPQSGAPGGFVHHRFVLRDMSGGVAGVPGLIPVNVTAGQQFVYAFSDTLAPDVDPTKVHVIGIVQRDDPDPLQRTILNSGRTRLMLDATNWIAEEADASVRVHPNPADDRLSIAGDASLFGQRGVIEVFDATGGRVHAEAIASFGAVQVLELPREWKDGLYLVMVRMEGKSPRTARVVVQH